VTTGDENVTRFWDAVPCGLLTVRLDGTVVDANPTFLAWVGRDPVDVRGRARLYELLSVGGRIYWETHLAPLLLVERRLDEVALELQSPQGRLPVLLSAVVDENDLVHAAFSSARERVRYERELLAARTAAELATARVSELHAATTALSNALGVEGVVDALLDAVHRLGAAGAAVWVQGPDGRLARRGSRGQAPPDPTGESGRLVVPLNALGDVRGILAVVPRTEPTAAALDVDVLAAVGEQAGLALDRARLNEHNADVARELQHSLLAASPPQDPRFSVATIYRPGVELLEVGGDWHDVFLTQRGVLSFVVGDVVGRGLAAASAMGQLRSAIRAVAGPGVSPARLLSRLDRFVEQVPAAAMATVAYGELDLGSGLVTYVCAGHPPPLLLPAEGGGRLLWEGRSTPLGAFVTGERDEATVQLGPGDRLLLYTDGLIERRDRGLDDGLDALVETALRSRGEPLGDSVRTLTQDMLRDERARDDVCALLLCWNGSSDERAGSETGFGTGESTA
jgi:serine phosphatase RsbU (regulator of sigma subunit)